MQTCVHSTGIENICRCLPRGAFVFFKYRSSRKTDKICILEVSTNISVHFAKLTSMAFINDKYTFLCFICLHDRLVSLISKCTSKFLNGRNKHLFTAVF